MPLRGTFVCAMLSQQQHVAAATATSATSAITAATTNGSPDSVEHKLVLMQL